MSFQFPENVPLFKRKKWLSDKPSTVCGRLPKLCTTLYHILFSSGKEQTNPVSLSVDYLLRLSTLNDIYTIPESKSKYSKVQRKKLVNFDNNKMPFHVLKSIVIIATTKVAMKWL